MQVIPFGDRILVRRHKVGEKSGSIYLPDETKDRPTDLADVIYTPDLSFADQEILDNAPIIVASLTEKCKQGNPESLIALLRLNDFIKAKSIKVGDKVMISKYIGTDFHDTHSLDTLTIVNELDIIGLIK